MLESARFSLISLIVCAATLAAQSGRTAPDSDTVVIGERIIMLHGLGQVHHAGKGAAPTTAVGINLVTSAVRLQGRRVWVVSTSGDDSGWVDVRDVLPLTKAVNYFTTRISRDPKDWDAYQKRPRRRFLRARRCSARPSTHSRRHRGDPKTPCSAAAAARGSASP